MVQCDAVLKCVLHPSESEAIEKMDSLKKTKKQHETKSSHLWVIKAQCLSDHFSNITLRSFYHITHCWCKTSLCAKVQSMLRSHFQNLSNQYEIIFQIYQFLVFILKMLFCFVFCSEVCMCPRPFCGVSQCICVCMLERMTLLL